MAQNLTYYEILGVTDKAPKEIITAVYRAWMKVLKVHPDLGGDEELAKRINVAYETLKDAKLRATYDVGLARTIGTKEKEPNRRAPRTLVAVEVGISLPPESEWHTASTVDASALGLRLRTGTQLARGSHITIAFTGCAASAVEASVKWSCAIRGGDDWLYEAGVEFFTPVPDILRRLGKGTANRNKRN